MYFPSLKAVVFVCESRTLGVWGMLVKYKTYYSSSQGWTRTLASYSFVFACSYCLGVVCWVWVPFLPFLITNLAIVLYICIILVIEILKSLLWNNRFYVLHTPHVNVYNNTCNAISFGTQVKCMYYMYKTHLSNSSKSLHPLNHPTQCYHWSN